MELSECLLILGNTLKIILQHRVRLVMKCHDNYFGHESNAIL